MLSEFDYKLLKELSEKHLTLVELLQGYGDAYVVRCRYDKLVDFGLAYKSQGYILLTPLGKAELEDYNQRESAEKTSEERASAAILCAIASAIATVASAICAIATLFK